MTSKTKDYVDLEKYTSNNSSNSEENIYYKESKLQCYYFIKDLATLLILITIIFGFITLIIYIICKN